MFTKLLIFISICIFIITITTTNYYFIITAVLSCFCR